MVGGKNFSVFFFLPMLNQIGHSSTIMERQWLYRLYEFTFPPFLFHLTTPFVHVFCYYKLFCSFSLPCSRRQGTSVYPESSFSWVPTGRNFFFFVSFIILIFSRLYWHEFSWAQWVRKQGAKWWLKPIHSFFFFFFFRRNSYIFCSAFGKLPDSRICVMPDSHSIKGRGT